MNSRRWEEIQGTFDALVELDVAERLNRLTELGSTNPELRAAVQSLLAADSEADARLAPLEAAFVRQSAIERDPLGLVGRIISHFQVHEAIGAGGMGVVYRAEDTRLGRPVALKFPLPSYSLDATAKAHFLREARSAAALDHPNLCAIHEVGESQDGRLFLAMALYPGETLKARIAREGPLSLPEALEITKQIVKGVACAHGARIVHRDLKPGNIMILPDGTVKILDFGLAKMRDQSVSESGGRFGTVSYMAPEQIRGEAVDDRADLWALGVVLYEMITGRKPFRGEHEVAIAHAILHDEPPPPSTLGAHVPDVMNNLVLTLLRKDPAGRYPTADRLLAHLADIRSPIESAVPSARTRGLHAGRILSARWRWTVARRAAAAVGIVGVLLGAALLARRNGAGNTAAASRLVVMPFENRTTITELDPLGTMVAEWLTQGLTEAPFLTVMDTRSALATMRTRGAAAAPAVVGRRTGAGVVVAGSYFLQGDSLQFHAHITSTADGSILVGVGGVAAARDRPLEGAERLLHRVLGAFASLLDKDVSTFQTPLVQPPTYAAYREYVEGLELYTGRGRYRDAARRFERAAALDTTFLTARVWAAQSGVLAEKARMDKGWAGRADSLISDLTAVKHRLVPFDRARLDFVMALRTGDVLEAYTAALRLLTTSPGSVDARREAALAALRVLRPREALRRLEELDAERGLMRDWLDYWGVVAWAHHLLGQHEDELAAARRGRLGQWRPDFLYLELRALAALGRIGALDSIARVELPSTGHAGLIAFGTAGELMAHGHTEAAHRLARYAADLPGVRPPSEEAAREWLEQHIGLRRDIGDPYCYVGAHPEAHSLVDRATDEPVHWRAELALLVGDSEAAATHAAQLRAPGEHGSLLARILTAQGNVGAARAALANREARALQTRGTLRDLEIDRASVLVRLGDLERALEVLSEGLHRGGIFNAAWGQDGHAYPDLAPLWGNPRFQALIKPRG